MDKCTHSYTINSWLTISHEKLMKRISSGKDAGTFGHSFAFKEVSLRPYCIIFKGILEKIKIGLYDDFK